MASSLDDRPAPLGLWDTVSMIVGIVIGAGIYETAPFIMLSVQSPGAVLFVWLLGGALSLIGGLCYAELATTYPRSGGDYVYLTRAYAPWVGFLFGWAQLAVILTGSIGMMAYVFADYAVVLLGAGAESTTAAACAAVVALTLVNVAGAVSGARTQNVLSALKVIGLVAILLAGMFWPAEGRPAAPARTSHEGSFGLAMILVLYTYGGWNDAAYVAAEVREPRRNIPRALLLGIGGITLIYLLINLAYLRGLGFDEARASRAIAADVLARPLGGLGASAMSAIVMVSALGAMNGLIYAGSRVYASMGRDHAPFRRLAAWHPRLGTPLWSLLVQGIITLALIGLVGTGSGRRGIDAALGMFGLSPASWAGHGGFDTLLRCTAPVFWLFFLLTALALFVLRFRDPAPRAFAVPLYPLVPIVFVATCAYMLYSATDYAGKLTLVGLLPLLAGLIFNAIFNRRRAASIPTRER